MTQRESMLALLNGKDYDRIPIWFMGFDNDDLVRSLNPDKQFPKSLFHNPEDFDYPWDRLTDDEREKMLVYNEAVMKPVTVIGWGANMSLGHGGPGEFQFSLIEKKSDTERVLACETGCKRLVRKNPHNYRDYVYPIESVADYHKLQLPDPTAPERFKGFAEDAAYFKEQGYLVGANLNGFFSGPHYFCIDYEEYLVSMLLDPENTKRLIDTVGEWTFAAAKEVLKRGVECLILCDDLGSADNLLMSPEIYVEWIQPWHKKLCDLAHDHGAWVHLHSHGNIKKILPSVLETGVDMLNPWDIDESMNLVDFLSDPTYEHTIPVGGCHKFFFEWDRDKQNEYLTHLFKSAKKTGKPWMFMDTGGIPEGTTRDTWDFLVNRLSELARR